MPTTAANPNPNRNVLQRLRTDFAFWARVCFRINDKHGRLVPLILNRAQQILEAEERRLRQLGVPGIWIYCLKGRQGGVSTYEQGKNLETIWSHRGATVMTLAHVREDTDKLFGITRRAIENFPPELLPRIGAAQTSQVSFPGRDSRFWTGTAGATGIGRGVTLSRLHGSEFAYWAEPRTVWKALRPAMRPRSVVVLETTASGHGSEAHEFWEASASPRAGKRLPGRTGFLQVFLPWWRCDVENYRLPLEAPDELGKLEPDEQTLVEREGLDLEQIKWRRAEILKAGLADFLQEYAEDPRTCWMVAGGLFYDAQRLKHLLDMRPDPKRIEAVRADRWNGHVEVYADQEGFPWEHERVIVGSDTAEGGADDRSTFVARTFPSGRLLETFADSKIEPKALAALLNDRGRKHGHPRHGLSLLVVEKNAHGITVLRELRDTHKYPESRIYHRSVFDEGAKQPTDKIGWVTTGTRDGGGTQPLLLDAGREIINAACDGTYGCPSVHALTDAYAVKRDENGKVSLNGKDVLVAEMLAWQGRGYPLSGAGGIMTNI